MKIAGSAGSEDRKKFIAVCAFGVIAAAVLYFELRDPTPTAPPPAAPVIVTAPAQGTAGTAARAPVARTVGRTAASLDPSLHPEAMRVTESIPYEGSGRNIFSAVSAPAAIPIPIRPARPVQTAVTGPPVPVGPPPPPRIDLKFCGYFVSPESGDRQVILVHGDDVVLAKAGDIVLRRYRIVSVSANSIQVEDMPNNNKQVLPLSN